jgi:hypothetical protein
MTADILGPDSGSVARRSALSTAEAGRTAALASACERDLRKSVAEFTASSPGAPPLFPDPPIGPGVYSGVALANAFGSPGRTAAALSVANRTSLWIFALDLRIDHQAGGREEIDRIVADCMSVADGADAEGTDPLARYLAGWLRDELAPAAFPRWHDVWRDELRRMLGAMVREWDWKSSLSADRTGLPSLQEYLDNADNFGSAWVNTAHWIHTGDPDTLDHLETLRRLSREVQKILRLLNDLATHQRDRDWGDLNALMLGVDAPALQEHITVLTRDTLRSLAEHARHAPEAVTYLERQIAWSTGFYGHGADYWDPMPQ